jgi:hypothetical protein
MASTAVRWAGYVVLGLVLGTVIWAFAGQQQPLVPKLFLGVGIALGVSLGMELRRRLMRN